MLDQVSALVRHGLGTCIRARRPSAPFSRSRVFVVWTFLFAPFLTSRMRSTQMRHGVTVFAIYAQLLVGQWISNLPAAQQQPVERPEYG